MTRKYFSKFIFSNHSLVWFLLGLVLAIVVVSHYTSFNLINPLSYTGPHQSINAWKLYEIDKNGLNPIHYDLNLPDLAGGRFVSYWDPPLPYFTAYLFSKGLFFLGPDRYLISIKLLTFINFTLSYALFFLVLRILGVRRALAALIPVLFLSQKISLDSLNSVNMSGLWALLLPIYLTFRCRRNPNVKNFSLVGLSLSVATLQNPYYGAFSGIFISLPLLLCLVKLFRFSLGKGVFSLIVFSLLLFLPIVAVKGPDLIAIQTQHLEDPQNRNYITMQAQSYRFWHHLLPRSGSIFVDYVTPPAHAFLSWLGNYVDDLTIWRNDANNPSYLGIVNIVILVGLLCFFVIKIGVIKFIKKFWIYILPFLMGALIFSRGDIFLFKTHHIVFPWYRLQAISPLKTPGYYTNLAVLVFFILLAYFLNKVGKRSVVFILLVVLFLFIPDAAGDIAGSCRPSYNRDLTSYLSSTPGRNRVFIYLADGCDTEINPWFIDKLGYYSQPINRDGRYYQIYYQSPIYASNSLSWFDNYEYSQTDRDYRTLNSLLTNDNDPYFKSHQIDEIIYIVDGIEGRGYWDYFKNYYQRKNEIKYFNTSAVIYINKK